MPDDPPLNGGRYQSIIDRLVTAGWIEQAVIVDPTLEKRGKTRILLTVYGADMLTAFKSVHDELGEFDYRDRHELYDLLILWILESSERYGIEPPDTPWV